MPSRSPSWNIVEFCMTDDTITPFSNIVGGIEKIAIKERRIAMISIQILNVIFIFCLPRNLYLFVFCFSF